MTGISNDTLSLKLIVTVVYSKCYNEVYFDFQKKINLGDNCELCFLNQNHWKLGHSISLVLQLDERPTGDQEVAGSTLAVVATFFRGE